VLITLASKGCVFHLRKSLHFLVEEYTLIDVEAQSKFLVMIFENTVIFFFSSLFTHAYTLRASGIYFHMFAKELII